MKYYIIAGEASGDLHAAYLMKGIINNDSTAEFRFWGGNLMKKYSQNIVKHYKELAFMGFIDVLKNLRKILKNEKFCKKDIINYNPDCVILVDYPGFNLRIAEFTKKNSFKTYYYISPKIWAWKKSRAKKIKLYIDKMFVIFPFEIDFYNKFNYEAIYTGNPTVEVIELKKEIKPSKEEFLSKHKLSDKQIIALLSGSRKQEILRLLPEMTKIANQFKNYQFVVAGVSFLNKKYYAFAENIENVTVIFDDTYNLLQHSVAAVVTSGTATLETAMFKIPQVVCYKTEFLFYFLARLVVKIKFISLVNIILNKKVVEEVIQVKMSKRIKNELSKILFEANYRHQMLSDYNVLEKMLGEKGSPERTAKIIVESLK